MNTCVIGLGYVGLPTAAVLSKSGHKVLGVDIKKNVVDQINAGSVHIFEPDLDEIVASSIADGTLRASMKIEEAENYVIVVPTPLKNYKPDVSSIDQAVYSLCPYLKKENLLILESTSPIGTTNALLDKIKSFRPDLFENDNPLFYLAYCPERVLPGNVCYELVNNDRIVGGVNKDSSEKAYQFYKTFVKGKIHITDSKTAEMTKLVENSFRDLNIAFANELSMICDQANIDTWELIQLANKHPRVQILNPGVGVGGHCIAVDPWFIIDKYPDRSNMIRSSRKVNCDKTDWVINKIIETAKEDDVIACMGLSYKQDIDDLRESPALKIFEELSDRLGENKVISCDPHLDMSNFNNSDYENVIKRASIIAYLVPHTKFKNRVIKDKLVLDFCGVLNDME